MTSTDLLSLAPLIIIAIAPVLMMLTIAIARNFKVLYGFSMLAFIIAFFSIYYVLPTIPHKISELLIFDQYSLIFFGIIIIGSLLVTFLSYRYLLEQENEKEEYFIILFVASLGSMILVTACNFISLFLGLETLSISLFILIAYRRIHHLSIEAGVKYLVLASVASAFLLFGMGLIYAYSGALDFKHIAQALRASGFNSAFLLTGFGMMVVGIGFKLALVPFHMWTPDVYQGAPTPIAAYIATISKGGVMALLLRFFYTIRGYENHSFIIIISTIAVLSMFVGNLLAIRQQNLKRILAFSSIANLGYLLITILIGNDSGKGAAIFYLISYTITTIGAFGVISLLSDRSNNAEKLTYYKGLFWKQPWLAIVFTLVLLSLAGIPLTAGFMAKFYIVFAGIHSGLWLLVISLIINSVIGLYYYLRVITIMYMPGDVQQVLNTSFSGNIFLGLIAAGIIWLGLFPEWIFQFISRYTSLG